MQFTGPLNLFKLVITAYLRGEHSKAIQLRRAVPRRPQLEVGCRHSTGESNICWDWDFSTVSQVALWTHATSASPVRESASQQLWLTHKIRVACDCLKLIKTQMIVLAIVKSTASEMQSSAINACFGTQATPPSCLPVAKTGFVEGGGRVAGVGTHGALNVKRIRLPYCTLTKESFPMPLLSRKLSFR